MIPYSRPKLSDLYTLSQSKLRFENHTLHSGTYLYSPYMVPAPPPAIVPCYDNIREYKIQRRRRNNQSKSKNSVKRKL